MQLLQVAGAIAPMTVNRMAINRVINSCRRRPHPLSMSHDYTTWTGLSDTRWSARHLPPRQRIHVRCVNVRIAHAAERCREVIDDDEEDVGPCCNSRQSKSRCCDKDE